MLKEDAFESVLELNKILMRSAEIYFRKEPYFERKSKELSPNKELYKNQI
jgi:hypothetical protein